jgi:hypothetical protein
MALVNLALAGNRQAAAYLQDSHVFDAPLTPGGACMVQRRCGLLAAPVPAGCALGRVCAVDAARHDTHLPACLPALTACA